MSIERITRTAPARHFSGGYTIGPIESDLPPLRPVWILASGAVGLVAFCAWAYWFAWVTG